MISIVSVKMALFMFQRNYRLIYSINLKHFVYTVTVHPPPSPAEYIILFYMSLIQTPRK